MRLWALEEMEKAGEDLLPATHRFRWAAALGCNRQRRRLFLAARDLDARGSWGIAVNEGRGPEWHLFEGGVVDFLVAVLEGRERVSVFPEDVPSGSPAFRRA